MSWCIKNQQIKKYSLALKKIKRSTENNLNRNAEIVSLRFFCKKGVLKNFIIFSGKHLRQSLSLLIKLPAPNLQFIKKEASAQEFSYEFCKVFKSTYLVIHVRTADFGNKCTITSNYNFWNWSKILTPLKSQ